MRNRLLIEVNGPQEIYDMMRNLVLQNPLTMRILEEDTENEIIEAGNLKIDLNSRQVCVGENDISLTAREYDILLFLAKHPGRVFSHREIYEAVWGKEYFYDSANITSHIGHIRKKIEQNPASPWYIQTIHGVGYKFAE